MYSSLLALAVLAMGVSSQAIKGFNYGSTFPTGANKQQSDFEAEFNQAKGLVGAPGFTSARLYTMIQGGTTNTPISAIPAAIATNTRLLLGLWASAGQTGINNEIAALTAAVSQYGSAFTDLIDGISVGSEDLYRISPTGIENMSGVGAGPQDVANYIGQVRNAIANTAANGKPVGHVDTWTAWVNGSNQATINACDFVGMDAYPYFQNTIANGIDVGQSVFNDALSATQGAVGGRPVWVTETGWPVSGAQENQAVASIPNAQMYWDQVACQLLGSTNTWWYTLQDAFQDVPSPSFGLVGAAGGETPLFNLTCPDGTSSSSSAPGSSSTMPSASSISVPTSGASVPAPGSGSPGATSSQPAGGSAGASAVSSSPAASTIPGGASEQPPPASSADTGGNSGSAAGSTVQMTTYTTETPCPVTTTGSGGAVSTVLSTSTQTITSCAGGCSKSATGAPSPSTASAPQSAPSQPAAPAPLASSTGSAPVGACPAALSSSFEYPHLIVPVDKNQPNTALGSSYNGTVSSTVSSIFNFDVPPADSGKTCTLVFLLPQQQDLQTSSYALSGAGGIDVKGLQGPADQGTTYSNAPAMSADVSSVPNVAPGNSYTISSGSCAAGQRIGYEMSATGTLALNYFQDYNPSPIGLYLTVC